MPVTVAACLILDNPSTGKKNHFLVTAVPLLLLHFPAMKSKNYSLVFVALWRWKGQIWKTHFFNEYKSRTVFLLQRNLGEKTQDDFFFLHATRGLALWRSSYLTKCSEVWVQNWDFVTPCCKSRATVHTRVLVWDFAEFFMAVLLWFLPVLCYCCNSPGHQMITEILNMQSYYVRYDSHWETIPLENCYKKKFGRGILLPFLSPASQKVLLWKQWNPKHECCILRLLLLVGVCRLCSPTNKVLYFLLYCLEFFAVFLVMAFCL